MASPGQRGPLRRELLVTTMMNFLLPVTRRPQRHANGLLACWNTVTSGMRCARTAHSLGRGEESLRYGSSSSPGSRGDRGRRGRAGRHPCRIEGSGGDGFGNHDRRCSGARGVRHPPRKRAKTSRLRDRPAPCSVLAGRLEMRISRGADPSTPAHAARPGPDLRIHPQHLVRGPDHLRVNGIGPIPSRPTGRVEPSARSRGHGYAAAEHTVDRSREERAWSSSTPTSP